MLKESQNWLRTPVLDPLMMILRKRTVIGPIFALLVGLLVSAIPMLEPWSEEIFQFSLYGAGFLGLLQGTHDTIDKIKDTPLPSGSNRDLIRIIINEVGEDLVKAALNSVPLENDDWEPPTSDTVAKG